jgi:hypothetical protein
MILLDNTEMLMGSGAITVIILTRRLQTEVFEHLMISNRNHSGHVMDFWIT